MILPEDQQAPEYFVKEGMKAYRTGDYPTAIHLFLSAHSVFISSDNQLSAAEAANNLSVCYLKVGNAQKALEIATGTDEIFAQVGDLQRQAMALGNQAAALESLGKLSLAVEKYEESSRLLKQTGDLDDRAIVLQSLSELQMKMGHQLDAMATMRIALLNKKKPSLLDRLLQKLLKIPFGS
jgi:tetratricopeptide (TPR) repeat protein